MEIPVSANKRFNEGPLQLYSPESDVSVPPPQECQIDCIRLGHHSVASFAMLQATKMLKAQQVHLKSPRLTSETDMRDVNFQVSHQFVAEYNSIDNFSPFSPRASPETELDEASRWRLRLISILPSQSQCDILLAYFSENLNRIYQTIHMPTFRAQYAAFWLTDVRNIDLIWLSLLYAILCSSVLSIPTQLGSTILQHTEVDDLPRKWYSASRQCLYAGGFETKACLTQLQTFIITQPYWIGTNNLETMNSCLAQAIRAAQLLELDIDTAVSDSQETEMRHRIWWEICCSDLTWSRCLGLQPFIRAYESPVPIPLNCNDIDMTPHSFRSRPIEEPTETSLNVIRIQFVKIISRIYTESGSKELTFDLVVSVDSEVLALLDQFPWYFQPNRMDSVMKLPKEFNFISWQSHLLHTFIHVQRLKMYKPFLQTARGPALEMSIGAAESALAVYRSLKRNHSNFSPFTMKAAAHSWQICSTAITLGIFILVERPERLQNVCDDIELVISDLEALQATGFKIPCIVEGSKIIRKILDMYESNGNDVMMEPTSLVPEVYTLTGGRTTTQKYLERCAIGFIINADLGSSYNPVFQQQQGATYSTGSGSYATPRSYESYASEVDFHDSDFHFELTQDTGIWDRWKFF